MKTTIRIFSVLTAILLTSQVFAFAGGDGFNGIITYAVTIEGDDLDAATKAQMPSEMVMYYRDNLVRMEQVSPMYSIASITNTNDESVIILMDMMGQKFAVKQSAEELKEAKGEIEDDVKPEVKLINETKVIAGYTCKKAEVTQDGETMEVYYTNEISVPENENAQNSIEGIDGMLMEFTINQQGMLMTMTVKEVKKTKVKKSFFNIPSDYEIKTMDEFKTMFGG